MRNGRFGRDGKCRMHSDDPDLAEAKARHTMGSTRRRERERRAMLTRMPARPETLDEALAFLSWVAVELAAGTIDPAQAREIKGALDMWLRAQGYREKIATFEAKLAAIARPPA
jgi:hypothetical protein